MKAIIAICCIIFASIPLNAQIKTEDIINIIIEDEISKGNINKAADPANNISSENKTETAQAIDPIQDIKPPVDQNQNNMVPETSENVINPEIKENAATTTVTPENNEKPATAVTKKPKSKNKQKVKQKENQPENTELAAIPAGEDKYLLEMGINLYNSGDYNGGAAKFIELKQKYAGSPYAEQCKLWLAKCYSKMSENKKAFDEIGGIDQNSGEFPASLFLAAEIFQKQKDLKRAKELYYKVSTMYAGHEIADDALIRAGYINLSQKNGEAAVEAAVSVIKYYPERETLDDAYYLLGKCYETDSLLKDIEKARNIYSKFVTKADMEKNPVFVNSPLLGRVRKDLSSINKNYFYKR